MFREVGDDPVMIDDKLWDFAIVTSINTSIILLLIVRVFHINH